MESKICPIHLGPHHVVCCWYLLIYLFISFDDCRQIYVSTSYDATSHFETTCRDVLDIFRRATGSDFDFSNVKHVLDEAEWWWSRRKQNQQQVYVIEQTTRLPLALCVWSRCHVVSTVCTCIRVCAFCCFCQCITEAIAYIRDTGLWSGFFSEYAEFVEMWARVCSINAAHMYL